MISPILQKIDPQNTLSETKCIICIVFVLWGGALSVAEWSKFAPFAIFGVFGLFERLICAEHIIERSVEQFDEFVVDCVVVGYGFLADAEARIFHVLHRVDDRLDWSVAQSFVVGKYVAVEHYLQHCLAPLAAAVNKHIIHTRC